MLEFDILYFIDFVTLNRQSYYILCISYSFNFCQSAPIIHVNVFDADYWTP